MNSNWEYLNIELIYNDNIINANSIPKIVFDNTSNVKLMEDIDEIFNNMIIETLKLGNPSIPNDCTVWESVNVCLLFNDEKINETNKTKNEMDQYPSYGEGILEIYNNF
jgi:hypothetical protein